jgi:hypothetical protein
LDKRFSPGLQLAALGLRTAFKFITQLVASVQKRSCIPICAYVRRHASDSPRRQRDGNAEHDHRRQHHSGDDRTYNYRDGLDSRGNSRDDGFNNDSDGEEDDEHTALFDVRLGVNCWQEFDLQPLCRTADMRKRSSVFGELRSLTVAEEQARDEEAVLTTSTAILNILESWTADPSRIRMVHDWMMRVLDAPKARLMRKMVSRCVRCWHFANVVAAALANG